jgi:hypothetical protein
MSDRVLISFVYLSFFLLNVYHCATASALFIFGSNSIGTSEYFYFAFVCSLSSETKKEIGWRQGELNEGYADEEKRKRKNRNNFNRVSL